jgi:hypothetical protein
MMRLAALLGHVDRRRAFLAIRRAGRRRLAERIALLRRTVDLPVCG